MKNVYINYKIKYKEEEDIKITTYSDSDWASDSKDRKSISGNLITIGDNNIIAWKSKKQPIVTLSSMEAEYVAASTTLQDIKLIKELINFIIGEIEIPTLFIDNQSALRSNLLLYISSKKRTQQTS